MDPIGAIQRIELADRMRVYEQINANMDKELEALKQEQERIERDFRLYRGRFSSSLEKHS